ncbi:hypothetical protein ACJW30_04G009000 [Castanea mollissima]
MENPDHNNEFGSNPKRTRIEVDVANLPTDLGLRIIICNFHPNERDQIRRHYLQNKPCQPVDHDFPQSQFGKTKRRFNPMWFKDYPSWLEYSITKDATYCLFCYLFRLDTETKYSNSYKQAIGCREKGISNSFECISGLFLANHNEEIDKAVLENAPENHQMTSPDIQKEIANAAAIETINAIIKDIADSLFAIIVDESRDMSTKEQMAIALRYVDKLGHVNERFLGITHVNNISAVTLKSAIEEVFNKHSLSISRLRGQGYDLASNMRGELNGLKTLILKDNASAYYVHCFAHQLRPTLVAVAKNHIQIATFFNLVAKVFNIVGASCKSHDILREKRNAEVIEALKNNEISIGRGLNQEMSLKRPGDTQDGLDSNQRAEANILIGLLQTFEFVFDLHLMKGVLGISNELSQALQRKDQDIVNAMKLVDISKQSLQVMRNDGWNSLLEEVSAFLLCVACLNPDNLFSTFNKEKLIRLAQFYPSDFSTVQVSFLDNQLDTYIHDMRFSEEFSALKGIGQLAEKMVEMKKNVSYPLVYLLVTLALILPVATATVERAFSVMNIIKNRLRNRIGDQGMNDCLVTYIEKDIFKTIECEEIMQRFQNMKNRRGQLSKIS